MTKSTETKNFLKAKAVEIRTKKNLINDTFREGKEPYETQWSLIKDSHAYRKMHIAMSLARGKTMAQIEQKVREDHVLSDKDLAEIEKLRADILASWEAELKAKEEEK